LHAPGRQVSEDNTEIGQSGTRINIDATHDCLMGDSWFGSVTTAIALLKVLPERKDSITQIKTASSRYPKKFLEEKMKGWPGGSHLVLESVIEGETLYAVGYKYSQRKCLCFLFNEGASSTEMGEPYIAKWVDDNGNSRYREVDRPECCAKYFKHSNVIDVLNQQRQKELRLEKFWVTNDGYFRLFTTVFGICVVDAWNGYRHHLDKRHRHKKCDLMTVVNMMAKDMLYNLEDEEIASNDDTLNIGIVNTEFAISTSSEMSQLTSPSFSTSSNHSLSPTMKVGLLAIELAKHTMVNTNEFLNVKRKRTQGRDGGFNREVNAKRRKRNPCRLCNHNNVEKRTSQYCNGCKPPSGCKHFWLCNECVLNHHSTVRKNFEDSLRA